MRLFSNLCRQYSSFFLFQLTLFQNIFYYGGYLSEMPNVIIEEKPNSWDLMDIMNNVTSVHNCMDHQNQKYGMGAAFDSLNREKYV